MIMTTSAVPAVPRRSSLLPCRSFLRRSSAASRSFFFARNRADAAVLRRLLSSAAVSGVPPAFSESVGESGKGESSRSGGEEEVEPPACVADELLRVLERLAGGGASLAAGAG